MEGVSWLRFVLAFALVMGLIGLFALAMRKWGGRLMIALPRPQAARLKVVEACPVGTRHKLVLVRRDAVEHLLLIGPEAQTVVESGIGGRDEK